MNTNVHILRGGGTALVFLRSGNAPAALVYWGDDHAGLDNQEQWRLLAGKATPSARLNRNSLQNLAPDLTRGGLSTSVLLAHRDGFGFAQQFVFKQIEEQAYSIAFVYIDEAAGLSLRQNFSWDAANRCLSCSSELVNTGSDVWQIDKFSCPALPMDTNWQESLTLTGRWGREFQQQRQHLSRNAMLIEHREGRSGPQHNPSLVVGTPGFSDNHGEVFGIHLGWSGNYQIRAEHLADCNAYILAGEWFYPGEVRLEKGASIQTPVLYAVRSIQGLNLMSQCFHGHFRDHVLPQWVRSSRPVLSNSWEAVYFDHRKETLLNLIDAAAETGAEQFVLDDGWFKGRRDDKSALGDWTVCPEVYPQGLAPLVGHVLKKGMRFGLWVEPEMVSPDSELASEHPEWVLKVEPYENIQARNQWVLDLSHKDVYEHIRSRLIALLDDYNISYLKWDMNRPLLMPGDGNGRAVAREQVKAVYRLMKDLCDHQPGLEIESCSSGGARIDAGILRYTGRVWSSDNNDPVERVAIQRGLGLFFPPEIMGAHIGPNKAHLTGRQIPLNYRILVALQGQLGFELDLRDVSGDERVKLQLAVKLYQTHRQWIGAAKVWRFERSDVDFCVYVSETKKQALVWALTTGSMARAEAPECKVPGLEESANYQVSSLFPHDHSVWLDYANSYPQWLKQSGKTVCSAAMLANTGLPMPVFPPQTGILLYLEQEQ